MILLLYILAMLSVVSSAPLRRDCAVLPSVVDYDIVNQVYQIAISRSVTGKVMLATFGTAYVESKFNNLDCGDQDSVGVFQQRPSQNWGTVTQLEDVNYATNKFLDVAIPDDQANPGYTAGQLAQSVQRSDFPDRYDAVQSTAEEILAQAQAHSPPPPPQFSAVPPPPKRQVKDALQNRLRHISHFRELNCHSFV